MKKAAPRKPKSFENGNDATKATEFARFQKRNKKMVQWVRDMSGEDFEQIYKQIRQELIIEIEGLFRENYFTIEPPSKEKTDGLDNQLLLRMHAERRGWNYAMSYMNRFYNDILELNK